MTVVRASPAKRGPIPLWVRAYFTVPRPLVAAAASAYTAIGAWLTPRATGRRRRILRAYAARVGWPVAALDHRMRASRVLFAIDTPINLTFRAGVMPRVMGVDGEAHLRDAASAGRGVVVTFDHVGAYPLIRPCLTVLGYSVPFILAGQRRVRWPGSTPGLRLLHGARRILWYRGGHLRTTSMAGRARDAIEALRRGDAVAVAADGAAGEQVACGFFGITMNRASGPARLAHSQGSPIVPATVVPEADGRYRLRFDPPIEIARDRPRGEAIARAMQQVARAAEAAYRAAPWIARRHVVEALARASSGEARS